MKNFAEMVSARLQQAMDVRRMRQAELSRLSGVDKSSVSQYLSGKYAPKQDKLYAFAKVLKVSPAWLAGYDVPMDEETDFSQQVAQLCNATNMTPERVKTTLHMSQPRFHALLNGSTSLSEKEAVAFAAQFGHAGEKAGRLTFRDSGETGFSTSVAVMLPVIDRLAAGKPVMAAENYIDFVTVPDGVQADFGVRCRGDHMVNARLADGDIVYVRLQTVENGDLAAVELDGRAVLKRVHRQNGQLVLTDEHADSAPLIFAAGEKPLRLLGKAVAFLSVLR